MHGSRPKEPFHRFRGTDHFTTRNHDFLDVRFQEPLRRFRGTDRFATRIVIFSNVNAQEPFVRFRGTYRLNRQCYTLVEFRVPPRALIIILNKARGDQEPGLCRLWPQRLFSIIKGGWGISFERIPQVTQSSTVPKTGNIDLGRSMGYGPHCTVGSVTQDPPKRSS